MKSKFTKALLLIMVFSLCLPIFESTVEARASQYIDSYDAYISRNGSGNLTIWFDVASTGKMDKLGASSVFLYEKNNGLWVLVKTYYNTDYTTMLRTNSGIHSSSLSYSGTTGKQYYANVYIWAEKGGSGDSRSKVTTTVSA